jgi:hypothetical protein
LSSSSSHSFRFVWSFLTAATNCLKMGLIMLYGRAFFKEGLEWLNLHVGLHQISSSTLLRSPQLHLSPK